MAENDKSPTTSGTPGAGEGSGGAQRKIGGKYNSMEDAIEGVIKGQDEMFHSTREEMGAVKQLLERMMTAPIGSAGSRDSYNDYGDPYNRGRPSREDDENLDPTEFLSNPGKVLRMRDEKRDKRIIEETNRRNAGMIANAATILRFQMKNPDLDEYEDLVQGFLNSSTDQRDSLDKRLKVAAKLTRERVASLRKSSNRNEEDDYEGRDTGRSPTSDEFVEGAAGRSGRGPRNEEEGGESGRPLSADDELASEVMERKMFKSSRFAAPTTRK